MRSTAAARFAPASALQRIWIKPIVTLSLLTMLDRRIRWKEERCKVLVLVTGHWLLVTGSHWSLLLITDNSGQFSFPPIVDRTPSLG
jgi:hypothetical protein